MTKPSKAITRIVERSRMRYRVNHSGACFFITVCKNCGRENGAHRPDTCRTGWDFETFCRRCREANA